MESSYTAKERNSLILRRSVWKLRLKQIVLLAPTKGFPLCPSISESTLPMVSPNAEGPTLLEGSAVHCEVKTKKCCPFLFSVEAYVEGL